MDCQDVKPALSPYIDGELPREDAAGITAHLAGCVACRRSLEELHLISATLHALLATRRAPSPVLRARVMAALDEVAPARTRPGMARHTRLIRQHLRRMRLGPGAR